MIKDDSYKQKCECEKKEKKHKTTVKVINWK